MNSDFIQDVFGAKGIRMAVMTVLVLLSIFLLVASVSMGKNSGRNSNPATDVITVTGDGQATLPPDVARISLTIENVAATVSEAQAATTKQANAAIEYMKGQNIAEKDVKTLSYNITPQYSYPNPCAVGVPCPPYTGSPKVTGYQVSETIQVTVRDLENVGTLLGGLGKLSVQNISGPAFALDDSTAGYDAARADAIKKAKTQAKELAKELGVKLGKIVNYSESSRGYDYPAMMESYGRGGAMDAKVAPVPNVPVGENTYTASVYITYEIR